MSGDKIHIPVSSKSTPQTIFNYHVPSETNMELEEPSMKKALHEVEVLQ